MLQTKSILPWGIAILALVAAVMLSVSLFNSEPPVDQKSAQVHAKPIKPNVIARKGNAGTKAQVPVSQANHASLLSTQEEALVFLHDTSVTYDPAELPKIQPYLLSPDAEVQMAAIDAMVVLGDSAAAPMLREASRQTMDTNVVMEMLKAADYLELPPVDVKKMAALMKSSVSGDNKSTERPQGRHLMNAKEREKRMGMHIRKEVPEPKNSH